MNVVQFGDRVTWGRINPATGAVTERREPTPEGIEICPGPAGAKEWPHATDILWDPRAA